MSRSIHQTVKRVAAANTKASLTPDNPDLIALAQKTLYKRTKAGQRREQAVASSTGVKGQRTARRI